MGDTSISWTHRPGTRGRSWNPIQGCQMVSPGCKNCYAMKMAARFAKNGWSKGLINLETGKWTGEKRLAEHKLLEPLSWREPSTVFVNSMSDLFAFGNEVIAAVFGVMAVTPQHTYIVVTKRATEMREWFQWAEQQWAGGTLFVRPAWVCTQALLGHLTRDEIDDYMRRRWLNTPVPWPLPNVWLLVSVENQDYVWRIEQLLRTPAAVRGASLEPLLGPVDLTHAGAWQGVPLSALEEIVGFVNRPPLDWVIAGCESGANRRPADSNWFRMIRDHCRAAGTPFFLKQASDRDPGGCVSGDWSDRRAGGIFEPPALDGVIHNAFPNPTKDEI